jgi:hypothetical protein
MGGNVTALLVVVVVALLPWNSIKSTPPEEAR